MEKLSVTAKVPASKEKKTQELGPCTISVDTGKTGAEMIQLFGDEAMKSNAEANWIVTLQSNIRAGLKKGETPEQIQLRLKGARMGIATKGVKIDPVQAYMAQFQLSTPQEQKKMLAELSKRASQVNK